ncbi:hypothetical protein ES708_16217 [subsurface metagenome]
MAKPDVQKRLVEQVLAQIQKQYAQEQKDEAARLHNALVGVIAELKPSSENLLLVLELLRQEALGNLINKFEEIKATPAEPVPEAVPKE